MAVAGGAAARAGSAKTFVAANAAEALRMSRRDKRIAVFLLDGRTPGFRWPDTI
jgi:hypothetical protein